MNPSFVSVLLLSSLLGTCLTQQGTYCHADHFDPETYGVPSEGDELVLLHMIARHGDRSPIHVIPNENVEWNCHVPETTMSLPVYDSASPMARISTIPDSNENPYSNFLWKGNCYAGQLTEKGMKQHHNLGSKARDIYVQKLGFLPSYLNQDVVSARSTDYPRTKQSAENFFQGLYPKEAQNTFPWILRYYPNEIENLVVNSGRCPKVGVLDSSCYNMQEYVDYLERNKELKKQLKTIMPNAPDHSFGYEADVIGCRACHEKEFPCSKTDPTNCVTEEMARQVKENMDWEYDFYYRICPSEQHKSLRMGPYLKEVASNIAKSINGDQAVKFYHYSAHDTSIAPLLGSLGAESVHWPPYASNIFLELWKSKDNESFVRVLYNGEVLNVSWCDMNRCPTKTFLDHIGRSMPENFEKECSI